MYEQNNASSFANDYSSFTSIQRVSDCHHALPTPTDMADVGSAIFVVCSAIAITLAIRSILRAQEFKRERAAFKRLPILARAAFVSIMVAVIAYGGSKPGTNYLEKVTRPLAVLLNSGEQRESTPDAILLTENQQLAGFALTAVVTNETFDLSAPLNATVHSNWLKRGAAEDGFWVMSSDTFRLGTNHYDAVYVSSSGTLSFNHPKSSPVVRLMPDDSSIAFLAPLQTVLGIPPESRWNLLTATNSLFWHDITDSGSARFTWQNVLLQRDAALPLSFQAELFPSGDFIFRYDFSSLAPNLLSLAPDFVIGAQNNGGGETALIATEDWHCTETNHLCASLYSLDGTNLITTPLCSVVTNSPKFSLRWKNIGNLDLSNADPDGDGISTWDEVFIYHTDPENADTDGDGLSDAVEIASGTGTNGTSPLDPDTDGDGVPDGLTESDWLSHSLFGGTNAPNLMLSVATLFDDPPAAALNVAGLALPVRNGATWALRLEPGVSYAFRLANATDRAIRFEACAPGDAAGLTLTKTLEIQSRAQGASVPAGAFVIDDPNGLFDRGAISGEGNFGFVRIEVEPDAIQVGSVCLHDTEAAEFDVSVAPDFAADRIVWTVTGGSVSFSTRRGTVFLSLDSGASYATATGTISPTNSLFGSVSVEMSVHRHESAGVYCTACGYAHTDEPGCGHDSDCAALLSVGGECTCAPRFIQVNSDDDDLNGTEDRNQTILAEGENDPISLKLPTQEPCAYCSCGEGLAYFKVTGHSSGLRLRRNGDIIENGAEVTSFNSFSIEATQPSPLIGSHQITYDIYSESDSKSCRRITRHFTSANAQIKPDYDDSGSVDDDDAWLKTQEFPGGVWLLARRQQPYLIHLQNECPDDAVLSLALSGTTNWPALKASPTGPALLTPLSGSVTDPPLAVKNGTTTVWLDTASCTTTATTLTYTIATSNGVHIVSDSQTIQIIDTTLPERWIVEGGTTAYSFADVTTDIDWWLCDKDDNILDSDYGASFEVGTGLASGDYDVWAYFPNLYGDNLSYTPLHIVQIDIEQEVTNLAWTATSASLNLTAESHLGGGGVVWTMTPMPGFSVTSSDNASFTFSPTNSTPGQYIVRATSAVAEEAYDEVIVNMVKLEVVPASETNHVFALHRTAFALSTGSWTNVTWTVTPDLPDGARLFLAANGGAGVSSLSAQTVHVSSGIVTNIYTLTATGVGVYGLEAEASLEIIAPFILSLDLKETQNEPAHHTELYQTNALVIRRGQDFEMDTFISTGYDTGCHDLVLSAQGDWQTSPMNVPQVATQPAADEWAFRILSSAPATNGLEIVILAVHTPATQTGIGAYSFVVSVVPKSDPAATISAATNAIPAIILFNPWCAADPVYMAGDAERTEYVMEQNGLIWVGSARKNSAKGWFYRQFSSQALTKALQFCRTQTSVDRASPTHVSRNLAIKVRDHDAGLLFGQWGADTNLYFGGVLPWAWTGSGEILEENEKTQSVVKFAQCWVFAGMLCTMNRTLGIPNRPVTAFGVTHDQNGNDASDVFYERDSSGTWNVVSSEIWNFHVWNESWMLRKDRQNCDGWQVCDATYEIGPAPISAIKTNNGGQYDVEFVYKEVEMERKDYRKVNGTWTLHRTIPSGLSPVILTKMQSSNGFINITGDYK